MLANARARPRPKTKLALELASAGHFALGFVFLSVGAQVAAARRTRVALLAGQARSLGDTFLRLYRSARKRKRSDNKESGACAGDANSPPRVNQSGHRRFLQLALNWRRTTTA